MMYLNYSVLDLEDFSREDQIANVLAFVKYMVSFEATQFCCVSR